MRIYIFWFMSMVSVNFFAPLKESFLWEMFAKWAHKLPVCCEIWHTKGQFPCFSMGKNQIIWYWSYILARWVKKESWREKKKGKKGSIFINEDYFGLAF